MTQSYLLGEIPPWGERALCPETGRPWFTDLPRFDERDGVSQ